MSSVNAVITFYGFLITLIMLVGFITIFKTDVHDNTINILINSTANEKTQDKLEEVRDNPFITVPYSFVNWAVLIVLFSFAHMFFLDSFRQPTMNIKEFLFESISGIILIIWFVGMFIMKTLDFLLNELISKMFPEVLDNIILIKFLFEYWAYITVAMALIWIFINRNKDSIKDFFTTSKEGLMNIREEVRFK